MAAGIGQPGTGWRGDVHPCDTVLRLKYTAIAAEVDQVYRGDLKTESRFFIGWCDVARQTVYGTVQGKQTDGCEMVGGGSGGRATVDDHLGLRASRGKV